MRQGCALAGVSLAGMHLQTIMIRTRGPALVEIVRSIPAQRDLGPAARVLTRGRKNSFRGHHAHMLDTQAASQATRPRVLTAPPA